MRPLFVAALIALASVAARAEPEGLAVAVTNASEPVLCAEKDNVTLNLASPEVRRFRIEASHPAYLGALRADSVAPDWADCDISPSTSVAPEPRRVVFDDGGAVFLRGFAYRTFWRPGDVAVRVGDRVERGLDIVQLHVRRPGREAEEALVVYPYDGYWRIRPLSPPHLGWTAYGSSFLLGPIEMDGRPVVNLTEIAFDPATRTFTVAFAGGGRATVKVEAADGDRTRLDVSLDRAVAGGPFATLRSMYVTESNADVARIAVREAAGKGWREEGIMAFAGARATHLWAGRLVPSRHNTSAPDMAFSRFAATVPD